MNRDNPLLWFAGILAIGAVAGWALGNDLRVSAGLYAALVASFGVGLWCGREERPEEYPGRMNHLHGGSDKRYRHADADNE